MILSQAIDQDERKSIRYTIMEGDTSKFSIDDREGTITTREGLDYEQQNEYTLIVTTRDGRQETNTQYSATVMITVLVSQPIKTNSYTLLSTNGLQVPCRLA